ELLEQLFKLFDQDRDQCLPQENWIEFLKQRLTNEKQIDFAEQLESVAFCLCGEKPIYLEQFYQIFYAKGVSIPRTGFDKSSLDRLEQLFRQTVGNEKEIKREDFKNIVISKNPFFTDRVFEIFDKDNSGSISLQEFLDAMHQFAGQSPDDKIRFLFKVYDLDACMEENGMQFSEEQIVDLTVAMFEDADTNNRGAITYEALKNQLEKHGGLLENLTISIDRWLVPPKPKSPPGSIMGKIMSFRPYQLTLPYVKNNYVYLIFLGAFLIVNAALFISRAIEYRGSNWFTIFARACGQCLNFNCMFILVLMLRQCITFLRTRGFSSILPLDQHIYFHKLTGMFIFGYSFLHTIMHICNFNYMWLHIRGVGQWTNRLYEYFEREQEKLHNGEIAPSIPSSKKRSSNGSIDNNNQNPLRKLQATITRTLSNRDANKKPVVQLVGFSTENFRNDDINTTLQNETDLTSRASCSTSDLPNSRPRTLMLSPENKFHRLIFTATKAPLEKSLSMPDMQTKRKKRERLLALREYMRSESEKSFNECQMKRARLKSLGLAYLSPQNKSLAQSFRYMRNKPTIIAFKTPSLENCEQRDSSSSIGSVGRQISSLSFTFNPERQAEEGRIGASQQNRLSPNLLSIKPVNYPVGKPLDRNIQKAKCNASKGDLVDNVIIKISDCEGTEVKAYCSFDVN
ncbi:hypothetical protein NQ314_019030, partial [Rhamnusium bicolor]